jgi:hypothetical protein
LEGYLLVLCYFEDENRSRNELQILKNIENGIKNLLSGVEEK